MLEANLIGFYVEVAHDIAGNYTSNRIKVKDFNEGLHTLMAETNELKDKGFVQRMSSTFFYSACLESPDVNQFTSITLMCDGEAIVKGELQDA